MKSVSLSILSNEIYCLGAKPNENQIIYRVMHACIKFKLKIPLRLKCQLVRNIFSAF